MNKCSFDDLVGIICVGTVYYIVDIKICKIIIPKGKVVKKNPRYYNMYMRTPNWWFFIEENMYA